MKKIKNNSLPKIFLRPLLAVFMTFLIGCNQQHETSNNSNKKENEGINYVDSLTLKVTHTKRFAIDKSTNYKTLFLSMYYDEKEGKRYLTYQNRGKNCIQFYGFDSEILEKKICFPRQGPNSVRKLAGYKIINFDSIYVIDKRSKSLALFDDNGVRKKSYRLLHGKETDKTTMAMAFTQTSFLLLETDSIYLPAFPDRSPYYLGYPFVAVNLITGDYDYVGEYSDYYSILNYDWNENLVSAIFSYCYNPQSKNVVISFVGDPHIYTGHPKKPLQKKYLARSNQFYGTTPPDGKEKLSSEEYFLSMDSYRNLCYDPYRNLYYRSAMHRTELLKDDMTRNKIEDMPISIIILDKNFKKVGEFFLPPNRYFYRTMFVEKEGLYISTANYANPDLNEDYIEFDVFEPISIKP